VPSPGARGERPGRGRLSRSADFDRVMRQGRSKGNRFLVLYAFPRSDPAEGGARLGVSVSRKVGGAVERNRVKRLLREAFAAESAHLAADHDFVVVARPEARALGEREGMEGVRGALAELMAALPAGSGRRDRGGGSAPPSRPPGAAGNAST
jgi:ribonuclease P protein component